MNLLTRLLGSVGGPAELDEERVTFPDMDAAWDEAVGVLHQAGIDLAQWPLFLVLGQPQGGEEAFFHWACLTPPMPPLITAAPEAADAPLRLLATEQAVFITCPGASLLSRQAALLALAGDAQDAEPPTSVEIAAAFATIQVSDRKEDMQRILRQAAEEGRELTNEEREHLRQLERDDSAPPSSGPRASLFTNAGECDLLLARLQYLCRRIVRARWPHCPLNGMLVLMPFGATGTTEDAVQTGLLCQRDFAAIQAVFRLRFPVLALVCDLERVDGFREFLERFPADQRKQRLGQRHPWVPDLRPEQLPQAIESEVEWICQGVLNNWVYKLLAVGDQQAAVAGAENGQLVRFLARLRERQGRLARMLTSFVCGGGPAVEAPLFGGIYVAGTGQAQEEQAFVAGVVHKLIESQNYVAWTPVALTEDTRYRQWTVAGYALLGLAMVAAAWLGYQAWGK